MSQRVYSNIQRQLLAVIRANAFAVVAGVIGAESAAQAVFAHYRDKIALIEQAFELNVARFVETADAIDVVKRTVNQMIVGNRLYLFIHENPIEFATPGPRKIGIGAAARGKKETAVTEVDPEIFQLRFRQYEVVVPVHEQERRLVQIRIG